MTDAVAAAMESLRSAARARMQAQRGGKTRFVVQIGHCSQAVGARDVAAALSAALPPDAYMVVAGCDGACFAAPKIVAADAAGNTRRLTNATPAQAAALPADFARQCADANAAGPSAQSDSVDADADFLSMQRRVALDGCGELDAEDIDEYILYGGYAGLARALSLGPDATLDEARASGLRGRGGAYFPAAIKWQGARGVKSEPRYLVVNCEEGEPGIFKDRHLMEGAPHRIIEGAAIAAFAAGASAAYIYINAEANLSAERMRRAVAQAQERGLLGADILGSGCSLDARLLRGAGGYVCGDETTLLNTMEGKRREPRQRPPFPTEAGLWGKPTVINNAETLASVPYIMSAGADAFAAIGAGDDNGTKIIGLSGAARRPGVMEVPMGTTLRRIVEDIGGGAPDGRAIANLAVGGPSSGLLPAAMLDTPIKPGLLHESGVMLGTGIIALDGAVSPTDAVRALAAYNAAESCGKCTPCREGTPRMVALLDAIAAGGAASSDLDDLRALAELVNAASLCGLGQAAGNPVLSALHFYGDELALTASGADRAGG